MQANVDIVRINELARELGVKAKAIIDLLAGFGVKEKKTHSSSIPADIAEKVRRTVWAQTQLGSPTQDASTVHGAGEAAAIPQSSSVETSTPRPQPGGTALPSLPISFLPTEPSTSPVHRPRGTEPFLLQLPPKFSFHRGFVDFDYVFDHFDWTLQDVPVLVDLTTCESANYQALALLIQYAWFLTMNGCRVNFKYGVANSGPTKMLSRMGAMNWLDVLTTDGKHFGDRPGQMLALRRRSDVQNAINTARRAIQSYTIGFPDYLSYIVSELLYNATEHGSRHANIDKCQIVVPSVFQFGRYPASERLAFFFSDLGIGIKSHLEKAYPAFPSHQDAIIYALRPNVSGTFRQQASPYAVNNNAGMGLTYSSLMLKRLKGDMYIVSQNGLAHVSPEDVTTRSLKHAWPGTFVLVNLNISEAPHLSLEDLLGDIRGRAETELSAAEQQGRANKYSVSIHNYFGKWAEDKDAAISFRDRHLMPAVLAEKKIELDFRDVETAPHSFLNALLATPIKRLGVKAYQRIQVFNATGPIHEIIHTIFESNLPELK